MSIISLYSNFAWRQGLYLWSILLKYGKLTALSQITVGMKFLTRWENSPPQKKLEAGIPFRYFKFPLETSYYVEKLALSCLRKQEMNAWPYLLKSKGGHHQIRRKSCLIKLACVLKRFSLANISDINDFFSFFFSCGHFPIWKSFSHWLVSFSVLQFKWIVQ